MRISVIGCGYVGLVTGACLAEVGNEVVCTDCDASRIDMLQSGRLPIFEPHLVRVPQGECRRRPEPDRTCGDVVLVV